MRRIIALAVFAVLVVGCGEEKKKDTGPTVPPANDMFDKTKNQKGKKGPGIG